jgi:two-component system CheB/CheR fusion protein
MASLEKQDLPNVAQLMDELRVANEALAVSTKALAEADVRHKAMIGELNHRVRNMLAAVSAMASQTLARHVDDDTLDTFQERLHAMARTYRLLTEAGWSALPFHDLAHETLAAVADPRRFWLDGPAFALAPREALALGMVLHELAANALRHGALSNSEGRVDVRWETAGAGAVDIHWTESGGPPVTTPRNRGFGTLMVERQLAYELQGHSTLTYAHGGLLATLHLPLLQASEERP